MLIPLELIIIGFDPPPYAQPFELEIDPTPGDADASVTRGATSKGLEGAMIKSRFPKIELPSGNLT
jgi:hypothetical protein